MKPEPYIPPLPRALTDDEHLLLRTAAAGGEGSHAGLQGARMFATARRLEKLGLGSVDARRFMINGRGMAALTKEPTRP